MRKLFVFVLVFSATVCVAETKLPKKVNNVLSSMYAGAKNVEWTFSEEDYQVTFQHEGADKIAVISKVGVWKQTSTVLTEEMMPVCISDAIANMYMSVEIAETLLIEMPKTSVYQVTVDVSIEEYDEDKDEDIVKIERVTKKFDKDCSLLEEE
ncbi:MAG: hypothetical protein AAFO69_13455 [Bacteroidota bacterium]